MSGIVSANASEVRYVGDSVRMILPPPSANNANNAKLVTRFSQDGRTLGAAELTQKVIERVSGVYSADSVVVNDVYMLLPGTWDPQTKRERSVSAREIKVIRNFCWYDAVPGGVFFPTLLNVNSIYRKTIDASSIRDYLLNAKPNEDDVNLIFINTEEVVKVKYETISQQTDAIKELVQKKYDEDADFTITANDVQGFGANQTAMINAFFEEFKKQYQESLDKGRTQLEIAFAKSKSLTIKIPTELYDHEEGRQLGAYIEAPVDSGIATKLAISFATLLRSGKKKAD